MVCLHSSSSPSFPEDDEREISVKYYGHLHRTLAQGLNYLVLPRDCTTSVQRGGIRREDAEELPPFLLLDGRITSQDRSF